MTELARLRDVIRCARSIVREPVCDPVPDSCASPIDLDRVAAILGGTMLRLPTGSCLVIEQQTPIEEWHGRRRLAEWGAFDRTSLELLVGCAADPGSPVFLDIETTGLSGGAGTIPFVVGIALPAGKRLKIWQFFLPTFSGERALLDAVSAVGRMAGLLVTFNGKAFDMPILETRWRFHRQEPAFAEQPHLDLLHPARRFWQADDCSLSALEESVLGFVRDSDVAGFEIPGRYFQYVRHGDIEPLRPVFEHNRLDLLSLIALTARVCHLIATGPGGTDDPQECLALGHVLERQGDRERVLACYRRAATLSRRSISTRYGCGEGDAIAARALSLLARCLRREKQYGEAARVWREILAMSAPPAWAAREAAVALAVYHEHRAKDLTEAIGLTNRALCLEELTRRRERLLHRLARLQRKRVVQRNGGGRLFGDRLPP